MANGIIPYGQTVQVNYGQLLSFKTFLMKNNAEPSVSRGERFEILSEYTYSGHVPFDGRTQIELQMDGNIHLHYNNCRFEFRFIEYLKFCFQIIKTLIKIPFVFSSYKYFLKDLFIFFTYFYSDYLNFAYYYEIFV